MKILVCVKQVPDTTEIKINPETNTLIRAGVPSIVNPFDADALEAAARIKDVDPETTITVVTMGPEQATAALKECLSVGGDKAYLVSDRKFGGSDTLATSYILSRVIKKIDELDGPFEIIFCGKQAIDGDTAQVGPEIAEHLGYPQVTYAVETIVDGDIVKVKKETEEGFEIIGVKTPCLITVTKPSFEPRYPSIKTKMAANRATIPVLTSEDLDIDLSRAGLKGSPTRVKKSFTPPQKKGGVTIQEETNEESAAKLFELLSGANII
ncbi:electron transfer flavoprotein subunit beta/FixA family protein [Eubacterium barkeri]|uniref:Electron transfer flavoprotein small subunit n=1 Tax=Eubacterium barkeri TaxID=1528 RepID=A0A1H3JAT6_EUBBA|nr:electron transfer flavoprotein subunit beta/FixA family protein [Eubacterium barkeri]SDY37083.1 electron transfer flavoprotein beta subunit [Eubacterium barkeri]